MLNFIKKPGDKAQTATELAVFGAILLFIIGLIVRQSLSYGQIQNQNLRALRMAMKLSYEHSMGLRPSTTDEKGNIVGNTSRNFAAVLLVEDRLSAESAKYGALNRSPVIANAQGAHTRNLFMPIDVGEPYTEPVFDMFINGQHFPFTIARFKRVCTRAPGTTPQCPNNPDYPPGIPTFVLENDLKPPHDNYWLENCVTRWRGGAPEQSVGCPKFYTISPDNPENISYWKPLRGNGFPCSNPCGPSCTEIYSTCEGCPGGSCPIDYNAAFWGLSERFDLDRDGTTDVSSSDQDDFSWQWMLVAGFDRDDQLRSKAPLRLNYGEFFSFGLEEGSEAKNVVLDVDGDLKEERVIRNTVLHNPFGVIQEMTVLDSQDGDLDFSYNTRDFNEWEAELPDAKGEPGLMQGVAMYTRVSPGTFLEIREGALYGPGGNFVRSIQRKDHIDLVQRMIRLSNNTGRFCCSSPNPQAWCTDGGNGQNTDPHIWDDMDNPVEVCDNDCFSAANISRTCYDLDQNIIYVRSRVLDAFGHQWSTDRSSDDYIDFMSVPIP